MRSFEHLGLWEAIITIKPVIIYRGATLVKVAQQHASEYTVNE